MSVVIIDTNPIKSKLSQMEMSSIIAIKPCGKCHLGNFLQLLEIPVNQIISEKS